MDDNDKIDFSEHKSRAMKFSERVMREGLKMRDRDIANVNAVLKSIDTDKIKDIIKKNYKDLSSVGKKINQAHRDKDVYFIMTTESAVRAIMQFSSYVDPERDKEKSIQFTEEEKEYLKEEIIKNFAIIMVMAMEKN